MGFKKMLSGFGVVVFALTLSTTVFAGSHDHSTTKVTRVSYSECTVEDCSLAYNHTHSGQYYYGHSLNDGHDSHVTTNHTQSGHH